MKKILAILAGVLCFAAVASAQPRAIGLRAGWGGELSYQHNMGENFFEADLGFFSEHGFYLTGIYDFLFPVQENFHFYAGPGASLGSYKHDDDEFFDFGLAGQIGMEYCFNVPLQLSLDWRPMFSFHSGDFYGNYFALGFRYLF